MIEMTISVPFGTNISFISDLPSADFIGQRRGRTVSLTALCKNNSCYQRRRERENEVEGGYCNSHSHSVWDWSI